MSKSAFESIKAGLEDALAYANGTADKSKYVVHVPSSINVKAIRKKLGLSQAVFAARYGFSVGSVRDWEQGRANPDRAVRAYLIVIRKNPKAVDKALAA